MAYFGPSIDHITVIYSRAGSLLFSSMLRNAEENGNSKCEY